MMLVKRYGQLQPLDEEAAEEMYAMPDGVYEVTIKRKRNPAFFKKYHALIDTLFSMWNPEAVEHKGMPVVKNRTRFRKDLAICTGHYDMVVNIRGEAKAEARSIALDSMDEPEFEQLYSRTIDYALAKVVHGTPEQVQNQVNNILEFI